ncbi:DNA adenine methylase [Oscillospiraceae bacterium PP1C4]
MQVETKKISVRLKTSYIEYLKQAYATDSMTEIINCLVQEKLDCDLGYKGVIRPPFSALGGKQKVAASIVKYIPEHQMYIEPFGNTAAVLLKKPRSQIEVYNDVNNEVVNFFEVLRDDPLALVEMCGKFPYSETVYHDSLRQTGGTKLERAVRYFYLARCGFLGVSTEQFNVSFGKRNFSACYYKAVDKLWTIAKRFRGVAITCRDYSKVIMRYYDEPKAFFMLDPPYLDYDCYYEHSFGLEDYQNLAKQLSGISGKFMICHSKDERIDNIFRKELGCNRAIIRSKNLPAKPVNGQRPISNLYLYMNY